MRVRLTTNQQHRARMENRRHEKQRENSYGDRGHCLHTAGVTGSKPVSPTTLHLLHLLQIVGTDMVGRFESGLAHYARPYTWDALHKILNDPAHYWPTVLNFWSKSGRQGQNECWNWTGAIVRGYGRFRTSKHTVDIAPRVAYALYYGTPPDERVVCHRCDNPRCVNPHHLFLGSQRENLRDMRMKGRDATQDMRGEGNPSARLNWEDVDKIRGRIAEGETNRSIARDYPVSDAMISRIRKNKAWVKPSPTQGAPDV